MATFGVGDRFVPRGRLLDSPALADKMVLRTIARREVASVLKDNEIIEVYDHESRVRYVLLGELDGRLLHVVVAEDDIMNATVVISVYEPDEPHGWDPAGGFRARKEDRR